MRSLASAFLLLAVGCGPKQPPPDVKAPGNLPVRTESELAAEDEARQTCLDECAGEEDPTHCIEDCREKMPIIQVEVVPDGLEPAPETP